MPLAVALSASVFLLAVAGFAYFSASGLGFGPNPTRADNGAAAEEAEFPWTTEMLGWQRTGFHFQPKRNFMSGENFAKLPPLLSDFTLLILHANIVSFAPPPLD